LKFVFPGATIFSLPDEDDPELHFFEVFATAPLTEEDADGALNTHTGIEVVEVEQDAAMRLQYFTDHKTGYLI